MSPTAPIVSRDEVDWAGDVLVAESSENKPSPRQRDRAYRIISNWRSSHAWPLNSIRMTLHKRVNRVDRENSLIAQRLKRLSSIKLKLQRFGDWLDLSEMQDIAGCRGVVSTVSDAEEIHTIYEDGRTVSERERKDNYIQEPKDDGYRSIHYVYRYKTTKPDKYGDFNGLKVEIQVRSHLQHVWATANETVSTFTGQKLKAKKGEERWFRFFALMVNAIAMIEELSPKSCVEGRIG